MTTNNLDVFFGKHYDNSDFFNHAAKIIYDNKLEFIDHLNNNRKLAAVKRLKELTNGGLKECKDAYEMWVDGKINYIKEERKEKLERLAKIPLVDEIFIKIKNVSDDELNSILMKLDIDQLFFIDELFQK